MKVSRGVGVDHHSRLDITQLFIAQTSAVLRCFFTEIIRRFPSEGYLRQSPGIAAAAALPFATARKIEAARPRE